MNNNEDLTYQILQVAQIVLSVATLLFVVVAGFVLSKKLIPDLSPVLVLLTALGSAAGTFILFPRVMAHLGIAGFKRELPKAADRYDNNKKSLPSSSESYVPGAFESPDVSIYSVHFGRLTNHNLVQETAHSIAWRTSDGDVLELRFFPEPSRNAVPLSDLNGLREQYKEKAAQGGAALIELTVSSYKGVPSVDMISKVKLDPNGMAYTASATLLLCDFSFNIGYHCYERGFTGFRDSVIAAKFWNENPNMPQEEFNTMWFESSSNPEAAKRNRSDDECYDSEFPDHPLSRCRKFLRDLPDRIVIAPAVLNARPFS